MAKPLQQLNQPVRQKSRRVMPGESIGIVSPAGPVPAAALAEGIARLQAWGYRTVVGDHTLARRGYLAGSDAERAADFNAIWANPAVSAVLCARGGYGAMRILPHINWDMVRAQPKFFCGFSDITALHAAMERQAGLVTFHGPMAAAFGGATSYNEAGLLRALQSPEPLGEIAWPATGTGEDLPSALTVAGGSAEGVLAGGNLSLICALMGTPWEVEMAGRILVLEDVDEAPYRVDRMLQQLLLAGKLQQVRGILFGDSPTCLQGAPEKPSLTLLEVFHDLLVPLGIPVLYGFPCGHTGYRATLPFGVRAHLNADAGTLTLLESALV